MRESKAKKKEKKKGEEKKKEKKGKKVSWSLTTDGSEADCMNCTFSRTANETESELHTAKKRHAGQEGGVGWRWG